MLLKAKKQDRVYNIPNSSDKIEILEYTSHITWHGVKVHKE